jgi:small subunit ribosomal protein S4e
MHLKRLSMPAFWPLGKKGNTFVVTPSPGSHKKMASIPLRVVVRDVLGFAQTAAEARKLISGGEVLVDKKKVKDERHPVGLMDVVEFPSIKKCYRVFASGGGLELRETEEKLSSRKLCAIKGKIAAKGGKIQIGLHDGRTIITGKGSAYKPGDSLLIELPSQKIVEHFKLKEGAPAMVVAGRNIGATGKIKVLKGRKKMTEKNRAVIETKDGEIDTLMEYVLVGELK